MDKNLSPKYLVVRLIAEDENGEQYNQDSAVEILSKDVDISIEQEPEVERVVEFETGTEYRKVKKIKYIVTVDYKEGIRID